MTRQKRIMCEDQRMLLLMHFLCNMHKLPVKVGLAARKWCCNQGFFGDCAPVLKSPKKEAPGSSKDLSKKEPPSSSDNSKEPTMPDEFHNPPDPSSKYWNHKWIKGIIMFMDVFCDQHIFCNCLMHHELDQVQALLVFVVSLL